MASSKKPPIPEPRKPAEPEVVEMSLDEIADKNATVIGVPAIEHPDAAKKEDKKEAPAKKDAPAAAKKDEKKEDPKPAPKKEEPKTEPLTTQKMEPPKIAAQKIEPVFPADEVPTAKREAAAPKPASAPKKEDIKTLLGMPAASPSPRIEEKKEEPPEEDDGPVVAPLGGGGLSLRAILDGPKPRLYAFASIAALVVIVFIGVIIRLASGTKPDDTTTTAASVSATPTIASSAPPVATAPPPKAAPIACSLSGDSKVIAPKAQVASGVEVVAHDSSFAIGFATGPKEATTVEIDPATLAVSSTKTFTARDFLKRVVPLPPDQAALDIDEKNDALQGRRTIGEYDVGVHKGEVVYAKHGTADTKTLWKLDSGAKVESIRGVAADGNVYIAYRHSGSIWAGKGLDPSEPVHVPGLGQLGSPSIAAAHDQVMVAWADRSETNVPWSLRLFAWHPGSTPSVRSFETPTGGPGENVLAPSLTALADGSFLLVWTEGPMSQQQVRAVVLSSDGNKIGSALTISAAGVHAGQGRAAILPDGRGVIAFMSAVGVPFELRAIAIQCK